jgi:hypothetical protein
MNSRFLRVVRIVLAIAPLALALTAADCSDPMAPATVGTTVTAPFIVLRAPATNPAFARANGEAKFENEGGERELEIEVEDVPAGTALVFYLGDTELARTTADSFGNARINLNSDRGAVVPATVAGKTVTVKTPAGEIVVSGTF